MNRSTTWKAALAICAALSLGCPDMDAESEKFYESVDEARKDGAVENQQVPNWMPIDSSEIRVYSDLDVNDVWISFRLPSATASDLASRLASVERDEVSETNLVKPADVDWWPPCLTMRGIDDCDNEFSFYSGDSFYLALDLGSGEGFAWRR